MSKGVSKQCSILNYIRKADEDLHELIQDLCIGKMLIPRKGSPGITFLRPDKELFNQIQKMASGDEPEKAIETLQSLVLLDCMSSLGEFNEKKTDIPTYLRKKLQVDKVDSKKVTLANGAEIVPDNDFQARNDRDNINVYIISKKLVPTDGEDATFHNAKPKTKKGGADLMDGKRIELFEKVVKEFCETERDPAMELLVALYGWAKHNNYTDVMNVIQSKVSGDSLASLAIVLQPYKTNADYISDENLQKFVKDSYDVSRNQANNTFKDIAVYTLNSEAQTVYETLCKGEIFASFHAIAKNESAKCANQCAKLNVVKLLTEFYSSNTVDTLCVGMNCKSVSKSTLFAESELRVLSAMILENLNGRFEFDELMTIYRNCKLDTPHLCSDPELIKNSNLGFYYSTVYLIARSDALFYVPSDDGSDTTNVASDNVFINLNKTIGNLLKPKREKSNDVINNFKNKSW